MIKPNSDYAGLLAAAIDLVHTPGSARAEIINIGDSRFRLITEYHNKGGWVVVLMEMPSPTKCCEEKLKRYGLSKREVQVARLLVERQSNREIAEALDVTVHTAGRHTERVLQKLGVRSRRDVRGKLMGAEAGD